MTPKEKAQSLVDRMERSKEMPYQYAKQCALIAVDEILDYLAIIEQNETTDFAFGGNYDGDTYFNYWNEVKKEIEKL